MPPPQSIKELSQFLGLTGYYRNHISHYVYIINTLTYLIGKDSPYNRKESHQTTFTYVKRCLERPPILIDPDPSKPYYVFTDASK